MPTKRTRTLIIAAVLLYFFANQTQIGWLYVMSALLAGIVLASALLNRGMLRGIRIERSLSHDEISEGDPISITLDLHNPRATSIAQIAAAEVCPLADPESADYTLPLFVPFLKGRSAATLNYDLMVYKRGLHTFPPVVLHSAAPFGFFRT